MRTNRIESLTDAIFAIAMTLLVLEIRVPRDLSGEVQLMNGIFQLLPQLISFGVSFVILGILWIGHHNQMNFIHSTDRTFLWRNFLFFLFICLVPFSAQLLGAYPMLRPAIIFYAANLSFCSLALYGVWSHAVKAKLVHEPLDPGFDQAVRRRILTPPLFYFLAILLVLLPIRGAVQFSLILFILPIATYLFPGQVDAFFRHRVPESA